MASSYHRITRWKCAERATIVQQQAWQDYLFLPVHSFAYREPCFWTGRRRAESDCTNSVPDYTSTNPALANSAGSASPGCICAHAIEAIAGGYHSRAGKVWEHADPGRIGHNFFDVA
jgi:hypothetical protein